MNRPNRLLGVTAIVVASVAVLAALAGSVGSAPSLAAQAAQQAEQLSDVECAKAIEAYRYRGQILVPQDPLSSKLQAMLDSLAQQEPIRDNTLILQGIQASSVEVIWSLANACSESELPRLSSPGILIGNDAIEQLDGRTALHDATLGEVRATVFEDANRRLECVHIYSQHGLGGGACSDEPMVVAQLRLWFCEISDAAESGRDMPQPGECQSVMPTADGAAPPAAVIAGAAYESRLRVALADGRTLYDDSLAIRGTERRLFVIPIPGREDTSVLSVEGMPNFGRSDDKNEDESTSIRDTAPRAWY